MNDFWLIYWMLDVVEAIKRELQVDWDQFYPMLQEILKRVPSLSQVELESLINTPETFSPDCKWIIGESPEVRKSLRLSREKKLQS